MKSPILGFVKTSTVDFEGKIVSTIFLGNCNFRCPFCHNAELVLDADRIEPIPFGDIIAHLEKRKNILEAVCITGGEPTLHPDLEAITAAIKKIGYPIKLDTNGTRPDIIKALHRKGLIDYVAMDIKNAFPKYPLTAGIANPDFSRIGESIAYLMGSGIDYEFRTTLVRGFHTAADIKAIGELLKGAKRLYLQRFVDPGSCLQDGLEEIPLEEAEEYRLELEKTIAEVKLRNY